MLRFLNFFIFSASVLAIKIPPRRNAKILTWELPLNSLGGKILPAGLKLDSSTAQIVVAFYPNASEPSTTTTKGAQLPPLTELTVHVPVTHKGTSYMHCLYALADDDIAMLLGRDASGFPMKLAAFQMDLPEEPATGDAVSGSVTRRGSTLFHLSGSVSSVASDDESATLSKLFSNQLNLFGTQAALPAFLNMKSPMNLGFMQLSLSGVVRNAFQVKLDTVEMDMDNMYEPLNLLFPAGLEVPTKAFMLEMDVGHDSDAEPALVGALSGTPLDFEYFLGSYFLKYGGEPTAAKPSPAVPEVSSSEATGDYEWQNGRFVWFTIKVDPDTVASQLPPGATLHDDLAKIFVVYYPTAHLNTAVSPKLAGDNYPYHEFGVRLSINYNGKVFQHVVYILVDDDIPQFLGRDLLGTPKKLATFDYPDDSPIESGSQIDFSITRRGSTVLSFSGTVGDNTTTPAAGLTDHVLDLSVFACQFPLYFEEGTGKKPGMGQPAYIRWNGSYAVHESRSILRSQLKFTSPEPISDWFVGQPVDAGYLLMDYGKKADLHSRPMEGFMAQAAGEQYWADTYAAKYH